MQRIQSIFFILFSMFYCTIIHSAEENNEQVLCVEYQGQFEPLKIDVSNSTSTTLVPFKTTVISQKKREPSYNAWLFPDFTRENGIKVKYRNDLLPYFPEIVPVWIQTLPCLQTFSNQYCLHEDKGHRFEVAILRDNNELYILCIPFSVSKSNFTDWKTSAAIAKVIISCIDDCNYRFDMHILTGRKNEFWDKQYDLLLNKPEELLIFNIQYPPQKESLASYTAKWYKHDQYQILGIVNNSKIDLKLAIKETTSINHGSQTSKKKLALDKSSSQKPDNWNGFKIPKKKYWKGDALSNVSPLLKIFSNHLRERDLPLNVHETHNLKEATLGFRSVQKHIEAKRKSERLNKSSCQIDVNLLHFQHLEILQIEKRIDRVIPRISLGLMIKKSKIPMPEPGEGLFATRMYKKGELISLYGGYLRYATRQEKDKIIENFEELGTHMMSVIQSDGTIIEGLKKVEPGDYGGSKANDVSFKNHIQTKIAKRKLKTNARFTRFFKQKEYNYNVLLVATKDIYPYDEIYVNYPTMYDEIAAAQAWETGVFCHVCGERYESKDHGVLSRHIKMYHVEEMDYKCNYCPASFRLKYPLYCHMKSKHKEMLVNSELIESENQDNNNDKNKKTIDYQYTCHHCDKPRTFHSASTYERHFQMSHRKSKQYICNIKDCKFKSSHPQNLMSHLKVHKKIEISCSLCNKVFRSQNGLRKHEQIHNPEFQSKGCLSCQYCGKNYKTKEGLNSHIAIEHEIKERCTICNIPISKQTKEQHMQIHRGEKNFKCKICGLLFSQSGSMYKHQKEIHGVNGTILKFKCEYPNCDFESNRETHWKIHVNTIHKGIRFECPECGIIRTRPQTVKKHIALEHPHVKNKTQPVQITVDITSLKKKSKTQSSDNPKFHCEQCSYRTNENYKLVNHFEKKHNNIKYRCPECNKTFARKDSATSHIKLKHTSSDKIIPLKCTVTPISNPLKRNADMYEDGEYLPAKKKVRKLSYESDW